MSLLVLIISLVLLAIPLGFIALRLLLNIPVLKHFLLGLIAVFCGLLAVTAVLAAWDLYSYRALLNETPVASISFNRLGPQHYEAEVTMDGQPRTFQVYGDQWQMDVRMIKWESVIARMGVAPVYRLDRLAGRYRAIEDERAKPRTVYSLEASAALDLWHWLKQSESLLKLADAEYGSATYLPMADGATFQVSISSFGLIARPENRSAEEAVSDWSS